MNMKKWLEGVLEEKTKKPMPILSFPGIQFMDTTIDKLLENPELQGNCLKIVADKIDTLAAVGFMDLSIEAEAFGAKVRKSETEIPTVVGTLIHDLGEAENIKVPDVRTNRTYICVEGLKNALDLIKDRPVFAGTIGPFSLAGRLLDVNKSMIYCKKNPELLHTTLEKATEFIINYISEYKKVGAHGVVIAEPLAGILSPRYAASFSEPYMKKIVRAVKDEDFFVIYHNCGDAAAKMKESIFAMGCDGYHFGNSTNLQEILEYFPKNVLIMGNVDPVGQFTSGTEESIHNEVTEILNKYGHYPNFIISSGCDIPHGANWKNVEAFFKAVKEYYS